jgi:hypothetical protein
MRVRLLILTLALVFGFNMHGRAKLDAAAPASPGTPPAKIDFATQIKPLLEARCTPCHFAGGKLYQRLPFDRQETITTLGTKLFTRIKDENAQRLIRDFLAQESERDHARP